MVSRVVDGGWASELEEALRLDASELLIVSPFIKLGVVARLLKNPAAGARVITRFNLQDFAQGVSDTAALRRLVEAGAAVRGIRNLHAKLYVFGSSRAIITSANLTEAGMNRNLEFGVVSEETGVVMASRDYFERLWERAGPDLTACTMGAWNAEITGRLIRGGRFAGPDELADHGADIGLPHIPDRAAPATFEDRAQAFVKFLGQGHDRASLSESVVSELDGSGCHWALCYPATRRPRGVRDGAVMFIARLVEGRDIHVFGRGVGLAHVPGRDEATHVDIRRRSWKSDWPCYIRVHDTEFVDGTLANGVSLGELMDALGYRCFKSTARNASAGQGNTNPRLAIRRHAAVELTEEGAAWLSRQLEHRLEVHGKVPQTTLRSLDWPATPTTGR